MASSKTPRHDTIDLGWLYEKLDKLRGNLQGLLVGKHPRIPNVREVLEEIMLTNLTKLRNDVAISKVRQFEEKYHTTLTQLEQDGLPDEADYEMHEEYILWRHWASVADETNETDVNAEIVS